MVKRSEYLLWVGVGYLAVVGFIALFLTILNVGPRFGPGLGDPGWSAFLGVLLILPAIAPALTRFIAPRVRRLKIAELVEIQFTDATTPAFSLAGLVEPLRLPDQMAAPEYANTMTSLSNDILQTVDRLEQSGEEVLVVDLAQGRSWLVPNLYFLSLLVARRTAVRQIAFMETRATDGVFVCMCTPRELLEAVDRAFPVLRSAADTLGYAELMGREPTAGKHFFGDLAARLSDPGVGAPAPLKEFWLSAGTLLGILGAGAHADRLEWRLPLHEPDYRIVLQSEHPYLAAIENGDLLFLVSRDRVALAIARRLAEHGAIETR